MTDITVPVSDGTPSQEAPTTDTDTAPAGPPAKKTAAKKSAPRKRAPKKAVAPTAEAPVEASTDAPAPEAPAEVQAADPGAETTAEAPAPAKKATARKRTAKKPAAKKAATKNETSSTPPSADEAGAAAAEVTDTTDVTEEAAGAPAAPALFFQAPDPEVAKAPRKRAKPKSKPEPEPTEDETTEDEATEDAETVDDAGAEPADEQATDEQATDEDNSDEEASDEADGEEGATAPRRRRRRGGRRRRKPAGASANDDADDAGDDEVAAEAADEAEASTDEDSDAAEADADEAGGSTSSRRRRRRRRAGETSGNGEDDPENTVVKVRESRPLEQQITAVSGSTRLEAKKQRRREGREAGRRRAPIVSEAEFLARRESVDRVMVIRQREDITQIAVLEDKVLVEHYVARESQTSLIGNVYLGRVQNVLPSMEAAFVDIGKGRNAVLYAGEVNWSALGHQEGQPRKIESVLTSGQRVLVQVTKDPVGHKGARLTSQISLACRSMVYVPDGTTSGISRKLPDTERNRLKTLLKEIVPDTAGVIVRTAAEGASEEELTSDVERLKARWTDIEKKSGGNAPQLLYGEPDLTLKVVRDLFTEDFSKLVIQGDEAWETVQSYVEHVAPDLGERLEKFDSDSNAADIFATYRINEQIAKGLDRKVWLPSGGSLVIDRTEAMTVVDVNTGKFTGSGGNLEETVTKNNLEAAEEIVRQLRLRDIGGIIVVDFIDMVLESNRDLVLRRLVECLGRDRTRHQVAEVTSLGLVQMTRKRIGTGLLEAFSETCTHCAGRGLTIHDHPIEGGNATAPIQDEPRRSRRSRNKSNQATPEPPKPPSPADVAAMIHHHEDVAEPVLEMEDQTLPDDQSPGDQIPSDEADTEVLEPVGAVEIDEVVEFPSVDAVNFPSETDEDTLDAADVSVAAMDHEPVVADSEVVIVSAAPITSDEPIKIVTRTRRGASRAVVSTGEGTVIAAATDATTAVIETPEPPKVITRTRGGSRRTTSDD